MNDLIKLLDELDYTKINHKIMLDDPLYPDGVEEDVLSYIGKKGRFVRRIDICRNLIEVTIFDSTHMKASQASTHSEINKDMIDWFMYHVENMENEFKKEDK
jgi:hypothetical protein